MVASILNALKLLLDIGTICIDIITAAMEVYHRCYKEFQLKYAAQAA